MKAGALAERFEQLATLPEAVPSLRKLILSLAVRGKLVPGCQWAPARMGDRIILVSGQHLLPSDYNSEGRGLPYLTGPTDFGKKHPVPTRWTTTPKATAHPGDILLTVKGSGVGKTNMLAGTSMAISRQLMAIRTPKDDPDFIHLVLQNSAQHFQDAMIGIAIPGIGRKDVLDLKFPLPPLAEQKRIVAKVDELMGLCDRWEAQEAERQKRHVSLAQAALARFEQEPTPANLTYLFHPSYDITPADLRKTILSLAVRGKLVPQCRSIVCRKVGECIRFLNGFAFKSEWFKESGIRLCRNANVGHGRLDWTDCKRIDQSLAKEFNRYLLKEGDIVLSLDRPIITTGLKVARIHQKDLPCLLLQRVAKPILNESVIDLDFLLLWFTSPDFIGCIDPGRSNGVPHISTRQIEQLTILTPSLLDQRLIVLSARRLLSLVDQLEAQLAESRAKGEKLLNALVAELSDSPTSSETPSL